MKAAEEEELFFAEEEPEELFFAEEESVVVKKRFLGHSKKFQKIHKFSLLPAQNQQNSSELFLIC